MKLNSQENKDEAIGTLMIVEDEPALLDIYEHYFIRHYNVISASSGKEALKLIQAGAKPEVILSDQFMPEMTGDIFLAETIKYLPDSIRIIITGNADNADVYQAINRSHSYLFLTKPINEFQILQAVRVCFNHYFLSNKNKVLQNKLKLKQFHSSGTESSPDSITINLKEIIKVLGLSERCSYINPQRIMNTLLWKLSLKLKNNSEDYKFLLQTLNLFCFNSILYSQNFSNFVDKKYDDSYAEEFITFRKVIYDSIIDKSDKMPSIRFLDYFVNINITKSARDYSIIDEKELELYLIFEFIIIYVVLFFSNKEENIDIDNDMPNENLKNYVDKRKEQLKQFINKNKEIYSTTLLEVFSEIAENSADDVMGQINSH